MSSVIRGGDNFDSSTRTTAWGVIDGATGATATLLAGYNVGTVTRVATGQYTVAFSTPLASANYSVSFSVRHEGGTDGRQTVLSNLAGSFTANGFRVHILNLAASANLDADYISFQVIGG